MGVTHKLKEQVIKFIIYTKKNEPTISCRKLSEIVHKTLNMKLSKSSINNILKTAHLSSPVGRRSRIAKKIKKFEIPAYKKEQLFKKSISSEDFPSDESVSEKNEKIDKKNKDIKNINVDKNEVKEKPIHVKIPPEIYQKKNSVFEYEMSKMTEESPVLNKSFSLNQEKPKTLYQGMGRIFLKAAEWDVATGSILGQWLCPKIKGRSPEIFSDILLFMQLYDIKDFEGFLQYINKKFWIIDKEQIEQDVGKLNEVLANILDFEELSIQCSIELPQIFCELNYLKIILEDGAEIWIDSQMTSVWQKSVQTPFFSPMGKLIPSVVKKLINNTQPIIFCSATKGKEFSKEFLNMTYAFENISGKRMSKISIYDRAHCEMANFDTIPLKKRIFIDGVWPWQKEYTLLLESNDILRDNSFYIEVIGKRIYYREGTFSFHQQDRHSTIPKYRYFLVYENIDMPPHIAIITNAPDIIIAKDVILNYIERWPNLHEGFNLFMVRNQIPVHIASDIETSSFERSKYGRLGIKSIIPTEYSITFVMEEVLLKLNEYCQKYYFPVFENNKDLNLMKSMFYNLPGYCCEKDKYIYVDFVLKECNYKYRKELEFAVLRVNESEIYDRKKRKLILGIKS